MTLHTISLFPATARRAPRGACGRCRVSVPRTNSLATPLQNRRIPSRCRSHECVRILLRSPDGQAFSTPRAAKARARYSGAQDLSDVP